MQNYILYIKSIINLFFNKTIYYKYIRYKQNIPFILMLGNILKGQPINENISKRNNRKDLA